LDSTVSLSTTIASGEGASVLYPRLVRAATRAFSTRPPHWDVSLSHIPGLAHDSGRATTHLTTTLTTIHSPKFLNCSDWFQFCLLDTIWSIAFSIL
jgi:hypothetical protein